MESTYGPEKCFSLQKLEIASQLYQFISIIIEAKFIICSSIYVLEGALQFHMQREETCQRPYSNECTLCLPMVGKTGEEENAGWVRKEWKKDLVLEKHLPTMLSLNCLFTGLHADYIHTLLQR